MLAMKRNVLTFISLCIFFLRAPTQVQFHTHTTTQVGTGIVYKHITVPLNLWNINVLEIDLTNPYLKMETVKANDRLQSLEPTSSMANRKSVEGHRIVAAVNGDFYASGGVPIGTQVINGEILKNPIDWPTLAFDFQNQPFIGPVNLWGELVANGQKLQINGINEERDSDELILYNAYYGGSSGTTAGGLECLISVINEWIVNDTISCKVEAVHSAGDMSIPRGKAVLSGDGAAQVFLQNKIQNGDTVQLTLNLPPSLPRLMQLVGGNLKILDNGVYTGSTNTDVHPRTVAGFSADRETLYLATVDGRLAGTYRGMSYRELADLMIYLGAEEAINLDGGGSTTMVVHGEIKNRPSDGTERSVANALLAVSLAPAGTGIAHIQVEPDNKRIFLKNSIQLEVKGWDEYYYPMNINQTEIQYDIDPILGQINENGILTVASEEDSGYVHVEYQQLRDSAYIVIKGINSIEIFPKQVTTDTIQTVKFTVEPTDVDNLHPTIALSDYQWSCLNPSVGHIDSMGRFKGIAEGQTEIVVTFRDKTDTALVRVEVGQGMVVVDSMETTNHWNISGVFYEDQATTLSSVDTPRTVGNKAFRLDYQFVRSSEGRSWVYLNTDHLIYGLPDTIMIDIKSNNMKHIADLIISDDNDELFTASTGLFSIESTDYETYIIPLSKFNAVDPSSSFNFPIKIKSLQIKLWYTGAVGDTNSGILYFDNLRVKYPTITGIIHKYRNKIPIHFNLYQNYPNPFNPNTTIRYEILRNENVLLQVYDLLGREVHKLVNTRQTAGIYMVNFEAQNLASGIYFYRLQAGAYVMLRKMILLH
jgi:hypothetical protein